MKKAVIYSRVSTKDQEREGYSIPAQTRILREYALKNELAVVQEFKDTESAGKAGRKAFGEMVSLLKKNKSINIILVEKTDRLYRNWRDHVTIDELDIEIHFVKSNRIISKESKSTEKYINDIETANARFYLNNLSEEVKKGQKQKALQGQYPGGMVPIGYIRNKLTKKIEIDPNRAPIIKRLFELYSKGEFSIDYLYKEAKKLKLTYPRTKRLISRSEIERLLKKEFYCGKFKWKNEVYNGDHPKIIEHDLFKKVQSAFKWRSIGKFTQKREFVFSRLIKCGICDNSITAEIKKGRYIYYHCTGYGNKHKKEYINENKIDSMFTDIVNSASLPTNFYDYLKKNIINEKNEKRNHINSERIRLTKQKEKIESYLKKTFQSKIDGLIEEEFFKSVYNDYQIELDSINYQLNNLTDAIEEKYDKALKTIELSHHANTLYLMGKPDQKRRLLKSLLSNCHLKDGSLYPIYNNA